VYLFIQMHAEQLVISVITFCVCMHETIGVQGHSSKIQSGQAVDHKAGGLNKCLFLN